MNDSSLFHPSGKNSWRVIATRDIPVLASDGRDATWFEIGDRVYAVGPEASDVIAVGKALQQCRPDINQQVIIYDLNTRNLEHYTTQDYETLYHLCPDSVAGK